MGENNLTLIEVDEKDLPIAPSEVKIDTEVIRNTERALDGTMCIDVIAKKLKLQIMWDLVTDEDYKDIKNIFSLENPLKVTTKNAMFLNKGDKIDDDTEGKEFLCYVDSVNAQPYFVGEVLHWQAVVVTLAEV